MNKHLNREIEAIMAENRHIFINFAYKYVRDIHLAEDIVQDVLVKCFTRFETLSNQAALKAWIYKIILNQCLDHLRSYYRRNIVLGEPSLTHYILEDCPDRQLLRKLEHEQLRELVQSLPDLYKQVVILFYYKGNNIQEIGSITNLKIPTIKTRLARARQLLLSMYEDSAAEKEYGAIT